LGPEFCFSIFPERLHQPGSRKDLIVQPMVLLADPRLLQKITEHIPDGLLRVINLPYIHDPITRDLRPSPGQGPDRDKGAVKKNVQMYMPAVPSVRRLDDIKTARDPRLVPPAKSREFSTHAF
jgi:hypothetical protein